VVRDAGVEMSELNVKAALIHVIGDFVQSIGVLIAAIIIWIKPEYKIADPVCTFLFSLLVLFTTIPVMRDSVAILLETVPSGLKPEVLKAAVRDIEGVVEVTDLHCWSISQGVGMLVVHVRPLDSVQTAAHCFELVDRIKEVLYKRYRLVHVTVEIDNQYLINRQPCLFGFGH